MSGLLNKLKKSKTPEQLVAAMVEALDHGQDINLAKRLSQTKFILYGEEEREPDEARQVEFFFFFFGGGGVYFCQFVRVPLLRCAFSSLEVPMPMEPTGDNRDPSD